MAHKVTMIACILIPCVCIYLLAMRLTPRRGFLRACEKLFIGIAAIYLLNLLLSPLELSLAQSPMASLATGYLGLPGVVLTFVVQRLL